ncbi:MAG: DUF2800 domain-containing protein [Ruthenibacterium sp.]
MATPEKHALLSASSAKQWLTCTAAPRLCENLPETTSSYAEAGRLAHAIAELKLRQRYLEPLGPRKYKNAMAKFEEDPSFDIGMRAATDSYIDAIEEQVLQFSTRPHVAAEIPLDLSRYVPEGFGTADCIITGGDMLIVIDYKNGAGQPVEVLENPQLMLYGLGALEKYQLLYNVATVRLIIVQPHAGGVKSWDIPSDNLRQWGEYTVQPKAQEAFAGTGTQTPSEDGCRWCKMKAQCTARAAYYLALESDKAAFDANSKTFSDNAQLADVLRRAAGLAAWAKDVEEYALAAALRGETVPGYKLVAGRAVRAFDNADAALADLIAAGYDEAILYERRPLTLAGIEKVLGVQPFFNAVGTHVITPLGKPTLVPEADKRKPLNPAETVFSPIIEKGDT